MKTILLIFAFFVLPFCTAQDIKVTSGSLARYKNFKSRYVEARDILVWLPEGYSQKTKYAVLYMHDGQMLFDANSTWNKQEWKVDETASELMATQQTKPFIVVAISSIGRLRHSDYFPQKPFESLTKKQRDSLFDLGKDSNHQLFGASIQSDNYLKFIVEELKPFVDKNFSVKTERGATFIAGSSMGGLISLYAICEYPEIFGGAACLSTHWPGTFSLEKNPVPKSLLDYLEAHLPSPKTHKIYFDHGDQTLDAWYKPYQLQADEIMKTKGYSSKNWETKFFEGADHSEKSWAERLRVPLGFLLGTEKP